MSQLFAISTIAFIGAGGTLTYAFTMGLVTFFAPCAYPLLPGYVSYYLGRGDGGDASVSGGHQTPGEGGDNETSAGSGLLGRVPVARLSRAVLVGVVVSLGFLAVFVALTGLVVVVGQQYLQHVAIFELVVGILLIGFGTVMASGRKFPTPTIRLPKRQQSLPGYFAFGVLYAAAAAGCSAPLFISVVLRAFPRGTLLGIGTLLAYALGMSALMIGVTVVAALGRGVLVRRISRHTGLVQRLGGVLLVLAGVAELYLYLFRFGGLATFGLA